MCVTVKVILHKGGSKFLIKKNLKTAMAHKNKI